MGQSLSPWKWTENDLQALERQQIPEALDLEYKGADALINSDANKREISKDVSAMANAAGGTIIYGVSEDKRSRMMTLTGGIDPKLVTNEWLEQVIGSGIQRRIDGLRINQIALNTVDPGKVAYIVWIPQSTRAPHMARDHRFYKRLGTTTALMEEYEIRDVARREDSPDLRLDFSLAGSPVPHDPGLDTSQLVLVVSISNLSAQPAFHASIRVFLDPRLQAQKRDDYMAIRAPEVPHDGLMLHRIWGTDQIRPLLEAETYELGQCKLIRAGGETLDYSLAWEIRSPKMIARTGSFTLRWGRGLFEIRPAA